MLYKIILKIKRAYKAWSSKKAQSREQAFAASLSAVQLSYFNKVKALLSNYDFVTVYKDSETIIIESDDMFCTVETSFKECCIKYTTVLPVRHVEVRYHDEYAGVIFDELVSVCLHKKLVKHKARRDDLISLK